VFVGNRVHAIDEKGRVTLPASMRDELGDRAFVTKYGGCLALWPAEKFNEVGHVMEQRRKDGEISEKVLRTFFSSAEAVKVDKAGRMSIPETLRTYAGLEASGDAVLAGQFSRIEIWSLEGYAESVGTDGEEELAAELAARGV
jgi:MraZ protein